MCGASRLACPFSLHFAAPCVEKRAIWYDKLGRLIRENNPTTGIDKTVVWCYDISGNILSRTEYDYITGDMTDVAPTATFAYTYGSNWKDRMDIESYRTKENINAYAC